MLRENKEILERDDVVKFELYNCLHRIQLNGK